MDEIWIADTASWEEKGRYVAFSHSNGADREKFEFYDGVLFAKSKNRMPIPPQRARP